MKNLEKQINDFIEYLRLKQKRSARTVRNYELYLRRFLYWLCEHGIDKPEDINLGAVNKFSHWLSQYKNKVKKANLKEKTKNYHLIAIRGFLRFLAKRGAKTLNYRKVQLRPTIDMPIDYLEQSELEKLLEAPLNTGQSHIIKLRDKALLELLFCSGLKVSAISAMHLKEVDLINGIVNFTENSFNLDKILLSNQAKHWLIQYIKERGNQPGFIFYRQDRADKKGKNKPEIGLTPRSIERVILRYAKIAGIMKKVTPQLIRHSFVRSNLLKGTDPETLNKMLGNKTKTMVKKYLKYLK